LRVRVRQGCINLLILGICKPSIPPTIGEAHYPMNRIIGTNSDFHGVRKNRAHKTNRASRRPPTAFDDRKSALSISLYPPSSLPCCYCIHKLLNVGSIHRGNLQSAQQGLDMAIYPTAISRERRGFLCDLTAC
jgi:hypothetical protein